MKAIVFDFDGLIFDTEVPEYKAFQEIFAEHGQELALAEWGRCIGTNSSGFDPYEHLEACLGSAVDREHVRTLKQDKYSRLIAEETVRPGVEAYLQTAKAMGLRIGLASSSSRAWVTKHLAMLGIADYFECIRVSDDVRDVKPDPELYLQVVAHFGIAPSEAVAFEDSPNGAKAAKAAGLYCVTVPNAVTRELTFGPVDLSLSSMADMRLEEVLARLEG